MSFSEEMIGAIDRIFRGAANDGRDVLYEHEVYQVLAAIGLEVPKFAFVRNEREISEELLEPLGPEVVCKIVSPQISHKQKLGGVKMARMTDPLFIQFVCSRMKAEVLAHFPNDKENEIKGFLIVEFIPHRQALGYEVLIGAKNDPAFGPVITVTKGGDDAEFFAANYDPANLFLPPLEYEYALKMLGTLHIRRKFEQIGHPEYLQLMAKATSQISSLAECYSIMARRKPEFILQAFEINPFVITNDRRFMAIDGFAQFVRSSEADKGVREINRHNLQNLFSPGGIAVIGVSADPAKYSLGREIGRQLHDLGRRDLFFINSKGGSVSFGTIQYPFYRRLADIPDVDLVVYAAPAQLMVDFIKQLKGTRVKAVILISGIPADINYSDFAKKLSEAVPEGLRILGPNCMGVFQAPGAGRAGLNTLFIEERRLEVKSSPQSNAALLTQSGAFAVTAIDKLQNARVFTSIASFGNKYDVNITDLMSYFAEQKEIDVLALYIEGLDPGEGSQFYRLAGDIRKPIIVYKSGRTEAGARAAASHTASMTGSYDVFKSACRQAGIIQAEKIEDHYDYVKVFSLLARKIPSGNRVAGVVNAGFESTVGADELKNLRQARVGADTVARLNRINKYGLADTSSPFLDITPMADDRMYAEFVEALLQDEGIDCVFVAVVPHSIALKTVPENCEDADGLANLLVNISRKYRKPMVVSVNAGRHYQEFVSLMEQNGLPVYTDIRSAIKSLDMFVSYHLGLEQQ